MAERTAAGTLDQVVDTDAETVVDVGVDVGATLAKLAVLEADGTLSFGFLPASALDGIARRVDVLAPASIGLTGCGAAALDTLLDRPTRRVVEFEAWGRGSRRLLRRQHGDGDSPYLLVSVGTGTSVLRVERGEATRLGGSALGGGTILGLGVALTGCASYEELTRLARDGQRANVDLLVGDIYQPGEIALPPEVTAAGFGKLARWLAHDQAPDPTTEGTRRQDLAAAVMGLVGENVGLICCGLAAAADISRIVYGGATLHENPSLAATVMGVTAALGRQPVLLEDGGFAGAVGALAPDPDSPTPAPDAEAS